MSPDAQQVVAVASLTVARAGGPRRPRGWSRCWRTSGTPGTPARSSGPPTPPGPTRPCSPRESVDVHNPKVVRSTAGSLFHLPVVTGADLADDGRRAARRRADGPRGRRRRRARPRRPARRRRRRAGRRPRPRAPDGLGVRQRGVGAARRGPRAGGRRRAGADPGPGRVAQPGDRGDGLPLRRARGRSGEAVRRGVAADGRPRPPGPGARLGAGCAGRASRRRCAGPRARRGT